jgi:hypothetical protein
MFHLFYLLNEAAITLSPSDVGQTNPPAADASALQHTLTTVYIWAGILCVITIIIGGVRYTTSAGDSSGVQSGKNTILYGIVGLVVVLMAAAITQFVAGRF